MMNYKQLTRRFYDESAKQFEELTQNYLTDYILRDARLFIENLNEKYVLDLGSGTGRDALFFKENDLRVVCVDLSKVMAKMCRNKGLDAFVMDVENLGFKDNSFDGVWAYTSLLHMPKRNFSIVLDRICNLLRGDGIFHLGMKEGNFEGWIEDERYNGTKRFYSLYQDKELRVILERSFNILHISRVDLGKNVYLNYLCRKN